MKRPLVFLAIAVSLACGSSSGSPPGPSQTNCDKTGTGAGPQNPADLESALTFQGRHDSGLDAFFGSGSADVFAQGDKLMAAAGQDMAAQLMVTSGDPSLVSASCGSALRSGLDAGAIHTIYRDMPLNLALSVLLNVIPDIPFGTINPPVPIYKENPSGDPAIKAYIEVTIASLGNSKIEVETKGTLTFTSSTLGTIQETQVVHIDMDVCPDASGKAKGQVSLTLHGSSAPAGGGAPLVYDLSVHNDFAYVVNDSAEIGSLEISGGAAYQTTGSQNNQIAVQASQTTDVNLHGDKPSLTIVTDDGSAEAEKLVGGNLLKPGDYVAVAAAPVTQKKWQDGTCVEIKVDPMTTSIRPGQKLHLVASVQQKFDKSSLVVPVIAILDGSGALTPGPDPLPAPAGYDYLGGQAGEMGDVTFTTTSKRGVAKKAITLTVCDACRWKGTVTIDGSGSSHSSLDVGAQTGSSDFTSSFHASFTVESDTQGNLQYVSGSADGTYAHTLQRHESYRDTHCTGTTDESASGTASGSADVTADDLAGTIFAYDGHYEGSFISPSVSVEGTEADHTTITGASLDGTNCAGNSSMDTTRALGTGMQITIPVKGSYDPDNPVLSGTSTIDGPVGGLPGTIHATWNLQ